MSYYHDSEQLNYSTKIYFSLFSLIFLFLKKNSPIHQIFCQFRKLFITLQKYHYPHKLFSMRWQYRPKTSTNNRGFHSIAFVVLSVFQIDPIVDLFLSLHRKRSVFSLENKNKMLFLFSLNNWSKKKRNAKEKLQRFLKIPGRKRSSF